MKLYNVMKFCNIVQGSVVLGQDYESHVRSLEVLLAEGCLGFPSLFPTGPHRATSPTVFLYVSVFSADMTFKMGWTRSVLLTTCSPAFLPCLV